MVVCGSLGTVEIQPPEEKYKWLRVSKARSWFRQAPCTPLKWGDVEIVNQCEPYDRYRAMFEEFAFLIRENKPSETKELVREAWGHRMILAACGISCDFKGEISL